jgi:hypothetical protein
MFQLPSALSGTTDPGIVLAQAPAFPAEFKTAMDGMPVAIQVAVSLAFFLLTVVSALGMVKWARRTEPKARGDVLLPGLNASIVDMNPVRDLVRAVDHLTAAVDRNTIEAARTASAIESFVTRQVEEENVDRKARSLFEQWVREHDDRPNRRPRT